MSAPMPSPVVETFGQVKPATESVLRLTENNLICVAPLENDPEPISDDNTCWGSKPLPDMLNSFWQSVFFNHCLANCFARARICAAVRVGGSAGVGFCGCPG